MKPITIKIHQLGKVKDSEIEILPFVIFSGESGLGKSYMAMLCHYFYEVLLDTTRINSFLSKFPIPEELKNEGTAFILKKKDLEQWLAKDAITYIGEMLGNTSLSGSIEVSLPDNITDEIACTFKEEFIGVVTKEDVYIILSMGNLNYRIIDTVLADEESPFSLLTRFVLISYIFEDYRGLNSTFVFPPSRGPLMTETIIPQTGMYNQFLKDLNEFTRMSNRQEEETLKLLSLLHLVMDGEVIRKDNKYIYVSKAVEIPLSAAAASVREIAPLEMLARKIDVKSTSILLEEPEAHLHPSKQRMMADILSAFFNAGMFMQITTHSDYLITRLNELINLNRVKEKFSDTIKFIELCDKAKTLPELVLDTKNIGSYLLVYDENEDCSRVEKQELKEGVPFVSFSNAIKDSLEIGELLSETLDEDN